MKQKLYALKNRIQAAHTKEEDVFRHFLDGIFEMHDDVWEISDAYSFYHFEERMAVNLQKQRRNRVTAGQVHIATQFFTPRWLAQFVVENSLGRFFPDAQLKYKDGDKTLPQPFYLKIFDPAVGTGNLFLSAYDLLEKVYRQRALPPKDIPKKILSAFFGLDIDGKAVAAAKRLLLKRAALDSFDFKIYSFDEIDPGTADICRNFRLPKLAQFIEFLLSNQHIGSLLKPYEGFAKDLTELKSRVAPSPTIAILEMLYTKFDCILVNPPYLAASDYDADLRSYVFRHYFPYKQDLFAAFIARCFELLDKDGAMGVVCPYNWMFIKSFENLRQLITQEKGLLNLIQLASSGYSKAIVYLSAFTAAHIKPEKGIYIRLADFSASQQQSRLEEAINKQAPYRYECSSDVFKKTPSGAVIYWLSPQAISCFSKKKLSDYLEIRQGMATGDNKTFLKKISDVAPEDIAFDAESIEHFDTLNKKYALYNKGGLYRKWFGNINFVIWFDKEAREVLACQGNRMPSRNFYFKECITWTLVSSKGHFSARYSNNSVFDVGGSCGFVKPDSPANIYVILGYLCSKVATFFLNALNPTLNAQVGDIKNLPFVLPSESQCAEIEMLVKENIVISQRDWYNKGKEGDFDIVKNNEQRLNKIFINVFGLSHELDHKVDDRLITIGRYNEK
jgi:hypothetical protein